MQKTYELRIFDTTLLRFALESSDIEGLRAQVLSVNEDDRHLLPLAFDPFAPVGNSRPAELSGDVITAWLRQRVIPKNRAFVSEILRSLGLAQGDTQGIIDVCKGLSLGDCYWVVPEGFAGTFAEYNLYENRFSEILALVAYTGAGQSKEAFTTSPELTTDGALPKAWRYIEGEGVTLYKGGTSGAANAGNEPYSEFYACQIARAMGLDAVQYGLEHWKGRLASTCGLFTSLDRSFIPIGRVMRTGGLKACLDYYQALGPQAYEAVKSMLVFDAVIFNEDRHFGNFGLLRDNHTGVVLGPAPLFDHGWSLFNFAMPSDFSDLAAYVKTRAPAYDGTTFEGICRTVMGKPQAAQLRRLIGFKFQRHPSINWPEERLQALEKFVQARVRELLALTPEKKKGVREQVL